MIKMACLLLADQLADAALHLSKEIYICIPCYKSLLAKALELIGACNLFVVDGGL